MRGLCFASFLYVVVLVKVLSGHLHFSFFCCFSCTDESAGCLVLKVNGSREEDGKAC